METKSKTAPEKEKAQLFEQLKHGLYLAAQVVLSIPFKLPTKVVQAAKYVNLAITLLDQQEARDAAASHPQKANGEVNES
jgi:hypothetical protein